MKTKFIIAFLGMFISASAFADTIVKVSCRSSEGINKVSVLEIGSSGCSEYLIKDAKGQLKIGGSASGYDFYLDKDGSVYYHTSEAPESSILSYCHGYGNVAMCRDDGDLSMASTRQYSSSFVYNERTDKYIPAKCKLTEGKASFFDLQLLRLQSRGAKGEIGVCG